MGLMDLADLHLCRKRSAPQTADHGSRATEHKTTDRSPQITAHKPLTIDHGSRPTWNVFRPSQNATRSANALNYFRPTAIPGPNQRSLLVTDSVLANRRNERVPFCLEISLVAPVVFLSFSCPENPGNDAGENSSP